jgi:hypothetical protein
MHEDLVGYLLNALEPDEQRAVEVALQDCGFGHWRASPSTAVGSFLMLRPGWLSRPRWVGPDGDGWMSPWRQEFFCVSDS